MVSGQPLLKELLPQIFDRLAGRVILAHNAGFDMGFLAHAFSVAGIDPPLSPWICSLECSRHWDRQERYHNLAALRVRHGLTAGVAHRALSDAQAAAEAFARMVSQRNWTKATMQDLPRLAKKTFHLPDREFGPDNAMLLLVEKAIRNKQVIKMIYTNRTKQREERIVEPMFVYYSGTEPMLAAFCRLRQDRRHFQLKRIEQAELADF